ncbi:MAG: magnesium transporter [Candidatus Syntropharchaeia archaeon]
MDEMLSMLPGLMILIPAATGMRGNVYGALCSRLGTSLHTGIFSPDLTKGSFLRDNIRASIFLTFMLSVILGFFAESTAIALGMKSIGLPGFILISVMGGIISGSILLFVTISIAFFGFKKNWDIDNLIPIITATGDVITLPSLYIATLLFLFLPHSSNLISAVFVFLSILFGVISMTDGNVKQIISESMPILAITGFIGIMAGSILDSGIENLISFPSLLILIPPFLGIGNAFGGILSARLASMLHMGIIEPKKYPQGETIRNFIVVYLLCFIIYPIIGLSAHVTGYFAGMKSPGIVEMILISLIGGLFCVSLLNMITYYLSALSFRYGIDPDNVGIPLTSSSSDIIGAFCLMAMIWM